MDWVLETTVLPKDKIGTERVRQRLFFLAGISNEILLYDRIVVDVILKKDF